MAGSQQSLVRVISNEELLQKEAADRAALQAAQAAPEIVGLAGYVRQCFSAAMTARQQHEQDMLKALRARNGEYDPEDKQAIAQQGGSDLYMRITSTKMRAAQSWLKDIYLTNERPFTLDTTPEPDLGIDLEAAVQQQVMQYAFIAAQQGILPTPEDLRMLHEQLREKARGDMQEAAKELAERAQKRIDDLLVEGGFYTALEECLTDLTTFKLAILKGPVIRTKKELTWMQGAGGRRVPKIQMQYKYTFNRVSPFNFYPAPNATSPDHGYVVERHKLFRSDLTDMLDVPGYSREAINAVLDEYGRGGLRNWLSVDSAEATALRDGSSKLHDTTAPTIDALEFTGTVQGRMLLDWGLQNADLEPLGEYPCNVWLIGRYVIKAALNHDPLGRSLYSVTSWEKVPGSIWGNGLSELLHDIQRVCNAAARSLVNNMAISSGPQVGVNTNCLPPGEQITAMHPWKVWQFRSDPMGGTQKPLEFFQPNNNAAALMQVFDKFALLGDEHSHIPRYMMGDQHVGGAGRTAAGLTMLMNAANKGIKNVANNIDSDIIVRTVERLYYYLMLYDDDPSIKGDLNIRARGAGGLMLKELINQRRLEFLQVVSNPLDAMIIKPEGRATILRELSKGLEMPPDKIVPSDPEILKIIAEHKASQAAQAQQGVESETDNVSFDYGPDGQMTGAKIAPAAPRPAQDLSQQLRGQFIAPAPENM